MGVEMKRFEVFHVALDPAFGREIKKTRPCAIISPDEMNRHIRTVIIAPMTSKGRNYPSRVRCLFQGIQGWIVLDQIRTVDKARLVKKLGRLSPATCDRVLHLLGEMFAK
jgi:mRNA interferase MazF